MTPECIQYFKEQAEKNIKESAEKRKRYARIRTNFLRKSLIERCDTSRCTRCLNRKPPSEFRTCERCRLASKAQHKRKYIKK